MHCVKSQFKSTSILGNRLYCWLLLLSQDMTERVHNSHNLGDSKSKLHLYYILRVELNLKMVTKLHILTEKHELMQL